jgi:hypothetical protein
MTSLQLSPGLRRKRSDGASQIQNKLTICGGVRCTGLNTGAPMSHSGTRNLCDMAPSRFKRFADWIILALCRAVQVEGPILEPCAGRGHMVRELRALGRPSAHFLWLKSRRHPSSCNDFNSQRRETPRIATLSQQIAF